LANPRASTVTLGELVLKGTVTHKVAYLQGLRAAFYAGACIGSFMVATTETLQIPYPLDLIGVTKAARVLRLPMDFAAAAAIELGLRQGDHGRIYQQTLRSGA
jgi:hypothetical protein